MIPSVGKSDRAAREDIVPAQAALDHDNKSLAGCLGAQSATMPPTSGLPDRHNTPKYSRSQQLHHLVLHVYIIWAAPPGVDLAIHSVIFSVFRLYHHSWQSDCRLHLVPRTVSLGRLHLSPSMLLHGQSSRRR